jgi:hypothetical protein
MKISFIMQSYLGEYPGSRANADIKFIRAVNSFLDQTHKDSELIIVSDGCERTHQIYYDLFKSEDRVKYVYVDKDTPNMYEGETKYYRGFPRQIARSLVTGEVTTYMDSDDFLLPSAAKILSNVWEQSSDKTWALIDRWYDNIAMKEAITTASVIVENETRTVKGLESEWNICRMSHPTLVMQATWAISHRSDASPKWKDVVGESYSEDTLFSRTLIADYGLGAGFLIPFAYYVRCHYSKLWDY